MVKAQSNTNYASMCHAGDVPLADTSHVYVVRELVHTGGATVTSDWPQNPLCCTH